MAKRIDDAEHYQKLAMALTKTAADHFYTYLMNIDLSNFDVNDIPETMKMKEPAEKDFYSTSVLKPFWDDQYLITKKPKDTLHCSNVYDRYKDSQQVLPLGHTKFHAELGKILGKVKRKRYEYYVGIKVKSEV